MDVSSVLPIAYDLADLIHGSKAISEYVEAKSKLAQDASVQAAIQQFKKAKEKFADCERFGHFHPDYHAALDQVKKAEEQLNAFELVQQFKKAEDALDQILYDVSKTIAHAVSPSIKVPSNNLLPDVGCGSGGACSGRCG